MEFIRPSFEIWKQGNTLENIWNHIAKCTRVCYQSEKKNDNESEEAFAKRVILRNKPYNSEANHLAMLEHGTVYLLLEINDKNCSSKFDYPSANFTANYNWSDVVGHIRAKYNNNKYSWASQSIIIEDKRIVCITTNLRVIFENDWLQDLQFICAPTDYHKRRITVSFTTNIGVSREFNRHRVNSIAEESTRYCNYNRRNFGEIKIGLPSWLLTKANLSYIENHQFDSLSSYCEDVLNNDNLIDNWCDIDYYLFSITISEFCYNALIDKGWKPQQAREILPLATKTQLIHTAFVDDWKHFFKLRAIGVSGAPHPNARELAHPLMEEFIKEGYIENLEI